MAIGRRSPAMPGRSTSGFHRPGKHRVHQAKLGGGAGRGRGGGGGIRFMRSRSLNKDHRPSHPDNLDNVGTEHTGSSPGRGRHRVHCGQAKRPGGRRFYARPWSYDHTKYDPRIPQQYRDGARRIFTEGPGRHRVHQGSAKRRGTCSARTARIRQACYRHLSHYRVFPPVQRGTSDTPYYFTEKKILLAQARLRWRRAAQCRTR